MPAVLAVQAATASPKTSPTPASADQGVTVLLLLLAGIASPLALFAGLRRLERREGRLHRTGPGSSRATRRC